MDSYINSVLLQIYLPRPIKNDVEEQLRNELAKQSLTNESRGNIILRLGTPGSNR